MPIWKDATARKDPPAEPRYVEPAPAGAATAAEQATRPADAVRPGGNRDSRESLIAPQIAIEGKIEGAGDVRIAGRFKGDVHVQGNLAVENGAKVTGGVRAGTVTIGGEVEGNIESASRVELLPTAVLTGDLKAESLTVAAGSRMRGQVEFGWSDGAAPRVAGGRQGTPAA